MTPYTPGDGSQSACVHVADFNSDNISDVAVTRYGRNNVIILYGFGDGSFLKGEAFSTDFVLGLWTLAFGDYNKDTRLDIVVINSQLHKTDVFLGYDSKHFSLSYPYSTGSRSQSHSVAVGHFNNEDQLDIVIANYDTDNILIGLGSKNGQDFSLLEILTGIGSSPYSVSVGDFNNDNRLDSVVTNSETDNIAIILGYGNGTFDTVVYYSTGYRSRPYIVTIADFDNDNILDVAVTNSGTNNILLLHGNGNEIFGNDESYPLGYDYRPHSLAVEDFK